MRPTQRPAKPLRLQQIKNLIARHFVQENNPKCVEPVDGGCVYGLTGCGVGCLLTQEDADHLDKIGGGSVGTVKKRSPEIYKIYFGEDEEVYEFLRKIQQCHDTSPPEDIRESIKSFLKV